MEENHYAPPVAVVDDVFELDSPPLWNPDAAANWCLLFSPVFGTWLHMKNWQALGESAKAASAEKWLWLSLVVVIVLPVLGFLPPLEAISRFTWLATFLLLVTWYFVSARGQATYVKRRFGKAYVRQRWGKPLLLGIGATIAYFVFFAVAAAIGIGLAGATH